MERPFQIPPEVKVGDEIRAKDWNQLREAVINLGKIDRVKYPQPGGDIGIRTGPGGSTLFAKRKGAAPSNPLLCFRPFVWGDEEINRLYVTPGRVIYHELPTVKGSDDTETPGKVLDAIVPTINGHALGDDEAYFSLAGRTSGSLWLVCRNRLCSDPPEQEEDHERLELAEKGAEPAINNGETAIPLAEFDLDAEDPNQMWITDLTIHWQSDWIQAFRCEAGDDDDDSSDSSDDIPVGSSSGSGGGGGPPGSSSDDDDEDPPITPPSSCCPPIEVVVTNFSGNCLPNNGTGPSSLLLVIQLLTFIESECPDCYDNLDTEFGRGLWASGQIDILISRSPEMWFKLIDLPSRRFGSDGGLSFTEPNGPLIRVSPVAACSWLRIIIEVTQYPKSGADPECEPLANCNTVKHFRVPAYCGGNSCISSSDSTPYG